MTGDRDEALAIFGAVLDAIAHAHQRGVLHRDLKPGNVMFVEGTPRVSDFGFGKRIAPDATDLTVSGQWFGSQHYMAPEQMSAKEATKASDVYALGKMLGELLTGERPEPFSFDAEAMPQEFRYLLGRACHSDLAKRYQDAGEMREAFHLLTSAAEVVDPPIEGAEKLIQEWMSIPAGADLKQVEELDAHFHRYASEEELYSRVVPKLPPGLRQQYIEVFPDGFRETMKTYDGHIAGPLGFSYCDVVADFYEGTWNETNDLEVERLIVARLWELGPSHNRWHVGEVLASMVGRIDDANEAMLVADVIRAAPERAEWNNHYLRDVTLPKPIHDALDQALRDEGAA